MYNEPTPHYEPQPMDPNTSGRQLELNSLIIEYKNLFDRSNKLDNKVYITITFCGFLFVFITNIFTKLSKLTAPDGKAATAIMILYVILCLATIITYIWLLIYFMQLLYPEGIERMDPQKMQDLHLEKMDKTQATDALIALYRKTIDGDLVRLKHRCDHLTAGLRIVILHVVLAFVTYVVQLLV